jgi:hypothetical protein
MPLSWVLTICLVASAFHDPFRAGLRVNLLALGAEIKARYTRLDLEHVLSDAEIDKITRPHPLIQAKIDAKNGAPLTQLDVLPMLPEAMSDTVDFPERCYLQAVLLVAIACDALFQSMIRVVAASVGLDPETDVSSAAPKSYPRAMNKLYSSDDHRYKPKPRCAFNIDVIRNLVSAGVVSPSPAILRSCHATDVVRDPHRRPAQRTNRDPRATQDILRGNRRAVQRSGQNEEPVWDR